VFILVFLLCLGPGIAYGVWAWNKSEARADEIRDDVQDILDTVPQVTIPGHTVPQVILSDVTLPQIPEVTLPPRVTLPPGVTLPGQMTPPGDVPSAALFATVEHSTFQPSFAAVVRIYINGDRGSGYVEVAPTGEILGAH
jgi:hypothetical protein